MGESLPHAILNYDQPSSARRCWFAWRPFTVSLLLGLIALTFWRAMPHILRIQETIGATNSFARALPRLQSMQWTQWAAIACGPLLIGVTWGLGDQSPRLKHLRRPAIWASIALPMLGLAAMAYFTFAPLVALDRELSVPYPHGSAAALPKHFGDTKSLFTYLAYLSNESTNSRSVAEFTAGCVIDRTGDQWVIAPTYNAAGITYYRGAQGNGDYYLVRPVLLKDNFTSNGFDLVGIVAGNGYKFSTDKNAPAFDTWWHCGGGESSRTHYAWKDGSWRETSQVTEKLTVD